MLEINNVEYKVEKYFNRWSVIDTHGEYALLENCTWGDSSFYLLVRRDVGIEDKVYTLKKSKEKIVLPTIIEVLAETYDDILTAIEDL
ncbi:MAG: hypothetical protein J6Q52_00170 [Clostridia bacterium]|nr:hypothetical protein [Clostridia bacterium]